MNKIEVDEHIERDLPMASSFLMPIIHKFDKNLRKMPKATMAKTVSWMCKKSLQEYIITKFARLGVRGENILATVSHGNNRWYYSFCADITDTMDIFSHHFFKRYAERMHKPFLMPVIIGQYFAHNSNLVKVYENPENGDAVYASREGLSLCRWDRERGMTKHCTFVSRDLLKPTQLEAFKTVFCKIEEAEHDFAGIQGFEESFMAIRRWASTCDIYTAAATEIYKQYFESEG